MIVKEVLKKFPIFSGLDDENTDRLILMTRLNKFEKKCTILFEDQKSDNLYIIIKGSVKITVTSSDGRELILEILNKGDFFNEGCLLLDGNQPINAETIKETEVLLINKNDLFRFLAKHPVVYENLVRQLIRKLQKVTKHVSSLALLDVSGRVARFFMDLAMEEGDKIERGNIIITRPTHQEIALRIGTTRESVSRAIKEMENTGLIKVAGKKIILYNKKL